MEVHSDMISSKHDVQLCMKTLAMLSLNAFTISRTSQNLSAQDGEETKLNVRLVIMYSNLVLDMHAFNLIGSPSCMLISFVEKISSRMPRTHSC